MIRTKLNDWMLEEFLRKYAQYEIAERLKTRIKQTSDNVWGKNVIRSYTDEKGDWVKDYQKLETWYVTAPFNVGDSTVDLLNEFARQITMKETLSENDINKYTCHQLCDWEFVEDYLGHIIRNDQITLVKYAVILKDLEKKNESGR